jgi:hypothetical protein
MTAILPILYGAALTWVSCLGLGLLILQALRVRLRSVEHEAFAFLAGSAGLSLLMFLLAALHLVRRGILQILAVLLMAGGIWAWRRVRPLERFPKLPRIWMVLFSAAFMVYGYHYFCNALAPEVSPDGSGYHLEIVAEYWRRRGLVPIPTNMYASMPQGIEMLFLLAFCFGWHSAAALVHFGFLMALPVLIVCYGKRIGFPKAGVFAALLVFASPIIGKDGISAYNDVALAVAAFGAFYALQIWDETGEDRLLPLAGLLAGFCFALKYTGALVVPYAIGYCAWRLLRQGRPWRKAAAIVGLAAIVSIVPWCLKNWIWVANPLAPFFNSWFPNPFVHISFEREYREILGRFRDGTSRWSGLLDAALSSRVSDGLLGPVFLLAPFSLLALRFAAGRRLLLAAILFLPGYVGNYGARFLIPMMPFVSLALGLALQGSRGMLPAVLLFHLLLSWSRFAPVYADVRAWRLRETPLRAALRRDPEDVYRRRYQPEYAVAKMIDDALPPGALVFMADQVPQSYVRQRILVGYQSALGRTLADILKMPAASESERPVELRFPFPAQTLYGVRVLQTSGRDPGEWTITEFRLWQGGRELPRAPHWRLSARPNPWDVQLAFDNSYVTRWNSREPLKPGQWVGVDFGKPVAADLVTLELAPGQPLRLRLEGLDASGDWKLLCDVPQQAAARALHGLRRAAVEELKARGVDYIVVNDREAGAPDFWRNPEAWGITELGVRNATRLYRLD